jgi:hypothetical protein
VGEAVLLRHNVRQTSIRTYHISTQNTGEVERALHTCRRRCRNIRPRTVHGGWLPKQLNRTFDTVQQLLPLPSSYSHAPNRLSVSQPLVRPNSMPFVRLPQLRPPEHPTCQTQKVNTCRAKLNTPQSPRRIGVDRLLRSHLFVQNIRATDRPLGSDPKPTWNCRSIERLFFQGRWELPYR